MTKIKELEQRILLKQRLMILIQEEINLLIMRLDDEKKAGIKWRAEERGHAKEEIPFYG